jgi:hypothetical protein
VTRCSFIHRKDSGRCTHEHQLARFEINIQGKSTGYLRDVIPGPSVIRSHRQDIGVRCHIAQCPSGSIHLREPRHQLTSCLSSVMFGLAFSYCGSSDHYVGHPGQRQDSDTDLEILVREIGFDRPKPLRH